MNRAERRKRDWRVYRRNAKLLARHYPRSSHGHKSDLTLRTRYEPDIREWNAAATKRRDFRHAKENEYESEI